MVSINSKGADCWNYGVNGFISLMLALVHDGS